MIGITVITPVNLLQIDWDFTELTASKIHVSYWIKRASLEIDKIENRSLYLPLLNPISQHNEIF